jgi:hypothetical protein
MSWLTRNLRQTVTRWIAGSYDAYGNPTFTKSIIKGRWEDIQTKVVDSLGNEVVVKSVVYLTSPVTPGDYLLLGSSSSITPPAEAREVVTFSKIPDIRNRAYELKATLK